MLGVLLCCIALGFILLGYVPITPIVGAAAFLIANIYVLRINPLYRLSAHELTVSGLKR